MLVALRHPADAPTTHKSTPWPNDDNRAASRAATCRIRSIWRRRGRRGVSLVPMGNGKAAPAGLTRSVRAHRFESSSPVTGSAHQHFPAEAEDEGDLEPLPVLPQRNRRVELQHLSRPRHAQSALHGAPPVLRCKRRCTRTTEGSRGTISIICGRARAVTGPSSHARPFAASAGILLTLSDAQRVLSAPLRRQRPFVPYSGSVTGTNEYTCTCNKRQG